MCENIYVALKRIDKSAFNVGDWFLGLIAMVSLGE